MDAHQIFRVATCNLGCCPRIDTGLKRQQSHPPFRPDPRSAEEAGKAQWGPSGPLCLSGGGKVGGADRTHSKPRAGARGGGVGVQLDQDVRDLAGDLVECSLLFEAWVNSAWCCSCCCSRRSWSGFCCNGTRQQRTKLHPDALLCIRMRHQNVAPLTRSTPTRQVRRAEAPPDADRTEEMSPNATRPLLPQVPLLLLIDRVATPASVPDAHGQVVSGLVHHPVHSPGVEEPDRDFSLLPSGNVEWAAAVLESGNIDSLGWSFSPNSLPSGLSRPPNILGLFSPRLDGQEIKHDRG